MGDKTPVELIKNELATQNYTRVFADVGSSHPNRFLIQAMPAEENALGDICDILTEIRFQTGPVVEKGVNGVFNEDLILIVLYRLKFFQTGKFACKENEEAIKHLEEALVALRKRTNDRTERKVLGTYEV